ncbi:MAG: hypothetical protein J7M11_03480, partial [Elusimicrobia bacterium]|nr:hypothetical protein [Elusimicrobiota bacterium]
FSLKNECQKIAEKVFSMLYRPGSVFVPGSGVFSGIRKSDKLGFVGEIVSVDVSKIKAAAADMRGSAGGGVVLVSPIASSEEEGEQGRDELFNVNADVSASRLAAALGSDELIYCTKVNGVNDSSGNLIEKIDAAHIAELISSGVIEGGMIPKVKSALDSLKAGVGRVRIGRTLIDNGVSKLVV